MLHRHSKSGETKDHDKTNPSSHTNYRFLDPSEKDECLHRFHTKAKLQISRLKERVCIAIEQRGIQVHDDLQSDLIAIMEDNNSNVINTYPPGSFRHIFWEQQHQASKLHQ